MADSGKGSAATWEESRNALVRPPLQVTIWVTGRTALGQGRLVTRNTPGAPTEAVRGGSPLSTRMGAKEKHCLQSLR